MRTTLPARLQSKTRTRIRITCKDPPLHQGAIRSFPITRLHFTSASLHADLEATVGPLMLESGQTRGEKAGNFRPFRKNRDIGYEDEEENSRPQRNKATGKSLD